MAGAAKRRANEGTQGPPSETQSSSGSHASSGQASRSQASRSQASRSVTSTRSESGRDRVAALSRPSRFDGSKDGNHSPTPTVSATGERNPSAAAPTTVNKNLDIPAIGYTVLRGEKLPTALAPRPAPSKLGTSIKVGLNTFDVKFPDNLTVYQYDVLIGSGSEKKGLLMKAWESKKVREALGPGFIYDGNKLAWCLRKIDGTVKVLVDLDEEQGRTPKAGAKENKHRVQVRCTNRVRVDVFMQYFANRTSFDNAVLETINFFDHVLRETPKNNFTSIKRMFFARGEKRTELGNAVEAFKGVFSSMRVVHGGASSAKLSVNVDVANGTFWTETQVDKAAVMLTGARSADDLIASIKRQGPHGAYAKILNRMRKLHVDASHRRGEVDHYVIERFIYKSAKEHTFEKDGKKVSIYDFFLKEHGRRLTMPELPLVKMTKGQNTVLPMEVLKIVQNQRYQTKLSDVQTSNMIRFAVTPPAERWTAIEHGLRMLNWPADPVLKQYGIKINPQRSVVEGRLLPAPKVQFGTGVATPGTSGRWDLKGKKFLTPNPAPLKSWALCIIPGRRGGKPDKAAVQHFLGEFVKIYKSHGGRVENATPAMCLATGDDASKWVTEAWNLAGNQSSARPQILVFILPDKDSVTYGRIKRSAECRYGVVSQCMQYAHVQKAQGQYISNVCMKFNAKLGGSTCRAVGPKSGGPGGAFTVPTAVIGADVSHAAPGSEASSMAAMTLSTDKLGVRYAAACETNGYRVEMMTTENITNMLKPLLGQWTTNVGGGKFPSHIIYFRDGVSEGQYSHVISQEVRDMKELIKTGTGGKDIPFLVIVGGKRHHVRFFPEKGDRNGNPFPGTLVETGVTHPFEFDFYLNSHAAIKGTARPMHYHVLLNEPGLQVEEIQALIYEQCYQYIRATTPISQHPAIYYAHLASNRAIPHDPNWAGASTGTKDPSETATSPMPGAEAVKLLPMPNQGNIINSMWFI